MMKWKRKNIFHAKWWFYYDTKRIPFNEDTTQCVILFNHEYVDSSISKCIFGIWHNSNIFISKFIKLMAPERCCSIINIIFRLIIFASSWFRIAAWVLAVKWLQVNANAHHSWLDYIYSGNGLVPPRIKALPGSMLSQLYVAIWHH